MISLIVYVFLILPFKILFLPFRIFFKQDKEQQKTKHYEPEEDPYFWMSVFDDE